jgi:hypothetical protein
VFALLQRSREVWLFHVPPSWVQKPLSRAFSHIICVAVLQGVDLVKQVAQFKGPGGQVHEKHYDLLIGADGVNSKIR